MKPKAPTRNKLPKPEVAPRMMKRGKLSTADAAKIRAKADRMTGI